MGREVLYNSALKIDGMLGPRSIAVRSFTSADIEAVERITTEAYGSPMSPSLRVRFVLGQAPDTVVAVCDGTVAGLVTATRYGSAAYVGSMAVDPARRRSGIARALMKALVERLERGGIVAMMLDATEPAAPLYASLGFVDVDRTSIFASVEGSEDCARHDATIDQPQGAIARAIALDAQLTKCDRSSVIAGFACEPGARVAVREYGYAIVRSTVVGPWLARDAATARALLADEAAAVGCGRRVFVPESNAAAIAIVEELGFARTRTLRHMRRGAAPFDRRFVFGQASLAHG